VAELTAVESWVRADPIDVGNAALGITTSFTVLARVVDADGAEGFGYAYVFRDGYARALLALLEELGADLIGADASDVSALWDGMESVHLDFLGTSGFGRVAQGVLDMALWDLRCKRRGATLTDVVGATRTTCDVYAGVSGAGGIDELCARAAAAAREGFGAVKIGTRSPDVATERDRVGSVRDAIGPGVGLIVDSFRRLAPAEAMRLAPVLAEFDLMWWEDPVPRDDVATLRALGRDAAVPLALGEDASSADEFRRLLETDAVSCLLVDLQRVGGITGWYRIAELAGAAGQRVAPHMFTHVGRHLVATTPNAVIVEYQPFWDAVFGPVVANGQLLAATEPGIGLGRAVVEP
jgi:L-alanine-DL-glutamate epimerase-like enolase superfamily enzyme